MKPVFLSGVVAFLSASGLAAETIYFEADENVLIVRTYDQYGTAVVEFIGEPNTMYQCVLMGADGQPIATATAMADLGQMMVQGVEASQIARVACRKIM
ncbi:hypothetical protein DZK27_08085 [Rhodobacteraceae bacterium 63075]|nr:hypothetical protein DZK27_08085 [Rhodobacteraceae bacterium 63075]